MYDYCEEQGYTVFWYPFDWGIIPSAAVMDEDGDCFIALDPYQMESAADELCKGMHEAGHCDTGAFYNQYATCDVRQKAENKADRRAIELVIPEADYRSAVTAGLTKVWELSEHFGVTPEFMRKAVCLYTNGNLAVELYAIE